MHRMNCLGHHGTQYLDVIGEHGPDAAEAMIPFLEKRDDAFPPINAMVVMIAGDAKASLRGHPAEAALERFAQTAERKDEREFARMILGFIRDPSRHAR